jgi:drug/metabolite transporter (DMT)-like permease
VLGSTAINSKGVNALVFALYRELSASVLMALLAAHSVYRGGHSFVIARKDIPRFVAMVSQVLEITLCPLLGGVSLALFVVVSQGLFSFGNVVGSVVALTFVSPTNLSVMQPAIPVFTMLLSVLFRMENLTVMKVLGTPWKNQIFVSFGCSEPGPSKT